MNDEQFFAWLDGELDHEASARVAREIAADPQLQRRAEEHRALRTRLAGALDQVAAAPVPASLLRAAEGGTVVDIGAARARKGPRPSLPSAAQWLAMAATLVIGIVIGPVFQRGPAMPVRDGQIFASADLAAALDTALASKPSASGPRIGLTFRSVEGPICRSFTDGPTQGLACRATDGWRIRGLVQGAKVEGGTYRMAAGPDPTIAALIESTMAGVPFDASGERASKARHWR